MLGRSPVSTRALFGYVERYLNESGGITQLCCEVFEFAVDSSEFDAEHFSGGEGSLQRPPAIEHRRALAGSFRPVLRGVRL